MVDLRKDSEQVRDAWRSSDEPHVPLSLAAALAFHEAHRAGEAFIAQPDYDDALDMAAAALSRVVDIYAVDARTGQPAPVQLSLRAGRFADGGSAYRRRNGETVTSLVVRREHVRRAMRLVSAAGIPFHFVSPEAQLR
jgi:hypothetical protein